MEFLPSFNLSYELYEDVLLRGAYSRTMTRPPLASLAPSTSIDASRLEGKKGNVNLLPYTANNLDFGAEWYFADQSLLAAAIFYKKIDAAKVRPVSIGGDHAVTGGILQAMGAGELTGGKKAVLLQKLQSLIQMVSLKELIS